MYLKYESLSDKVVTILQNYKDYDIAELQIVDFHGNILASSTGHKHTDSIDISLLNRLSVGETASYRGLIKSTGKEIIAVSTPLVEGNAITGYLRYVTLTEGIKAASGELIEKAITLGVLILLLSTFLTVILSRTIVRPIQHLTKISQRIAEGDFDAVAVKKNDDEIGKLADTLNFMTKEIKKSNELKNDFISTISHEIRTPLTSIKGWAETLNDGNRYDKETNQGINIILKESERLTKLVEELLDFSRFESGRINMNFDKVDLNLLVKDVLKLYMHKLEGKQIKLIFNPDKNVTYVTGDADRLRQVFINLIDNAYKFTHKCGIIRVTTENLLKGAKVSICDNGIGISADELSHITEKFYRGKESRTGSGLGLYITNEIMSLHKGSLYIESTKGEGTRVTISLNK